MNVSLGKQVLHLGLPQGVLPGLVEGGLVTSVLTSKFFGCRNAMIGGSGVANLIRFESCSK